MPVKNYKKLLKKKGIIHEKQTAKIQKTHPCWGCKCASFDAPGTDAQTVWCCTKERHRLIYNVVNGNFICPKKKGWIMIKYNNTTWAMKSEGAKNDQKA